MSDLSRRDFLIGLACLTAGIQPALATAMQQEVALSRLPATNPPQQAPALKGQLVATSRNEPGDARIFSFDLDSGKLETAKFNMMFPHDMLKIGEQFIVFPDNIESFAMAVSLDGSARQLNITEGIVFSGHALYDEKYGHILATAYDKRNEMEGYFVIIDPSTLSVSELRPNESYHTHDICMIDETTFAVCAYNARYTYGIREHDGLNLVPHGGHSLLVLYDRETLKVKQTIQAYNQALITHIAVTDEKKIFGIGNQSYNIRNLESQTKEDLATILNDYFMKSQPELKDQYLDIINNITLQQLDKEGSQLWLPLPNLALSYGEGDDQFQKITGNPHYHRYAQSVRYIPQTNMIAVSYPGTDGILFIDALTQEVVHSIGYAETGLREVRGLAYVEDSPYLIAGQRTHFSVIDTRTGKVVKQYDAPIGRVIHLYQRS